MPFASATRRAALLSVVLLGTFGCVSSRPEPMSYVIFFNAFSADLDESAKGVIAEAASAAKPAPSQSVVVDGYSDKVGTPQSNQILSRLRAQVVADGLMEQGVARQRLTVKARGATGGDPGIESRRVEIVIGR